jgi:2-dehydropantoate 2-reductase
MRIAIYGTGGLGGYYGARLHESGNDVTFIARGENLQALRSDGLQIFSPLGDLHIASPTATDDPATVEPVDAVLVAVKTWQVRDVAQAMKPMLKPGTMVVPFLNGVEAPTQIDDVLGSGHAVGGLSKIFSLLESPGVIRHFSQAAIVAFNELDGRASERVNALKDAFEGAGVDVEIPADVTRALWEKLIMVTSWAGIGALSRTPLGGLRDDPTMRSMITTSIDETVAVARAHGIDIADGLHKVLWSFYDELPAGATASLMRDMMDERPSELEAWNGAVHRLGEARGVPTPTHTLVYHLLEPMERRARGE